LYGGARDAQTSTALDREAAMALELVTAADVIALDLEGRQAARRAARETELLRQVFRAFIDRAGPISTDDIVDRVPNEPRDNVRAALAKLDTDDLIRIRDQRLDFAYPFSADPTPFVIDIDRGRGERYACCAIDALGVAPMLGRSVRVRSRCHHCPTPLESLVDPSGPEPSAAGLMVWISRHVEDRRACDSL
jgi:Alkylmercury lyase